MAPDPQASSILTEDYFLEAVTRILSGSQHSSAAKDREIHRWDGDLPTKERLKIQYMATKK